MKKFEYRLQKVLDVKEMVLRKAQRDLAYAENEKCEAQEEMHQVETVLERFYRQMQASGSETVSEIRRKYDHFYQLMDNLKVQKECLQQLENKVEEIRGQLLEKQKDHKILSKLKEKHYSEYFSKMEKEEQIQLDEMALHGNR
ncbi:MAG: flagellar export protein FliJ [Calditrichia bacterium]